MKKQKHNPYSVIDAPAYFWDKYGLTNYPNFSASGNVWGMVDKYYGESALLVKCDGYIYNLASDPEQYQKIKKELATF